MNLRPLYREDYEFLYELLAARRPDENITHKTMPKYDEHVMFMESKPYKEDWIIEENHRRIGRLYVTKDNKIGIHTLDKIEEKVLLQLVDNRDGRFQFEVSPNNKHFQKILKRNGYRLLHETYAKD